MQIQKEAEKLAAKAAVYAAADKAEAVADTSHIRNDPAAALQQLAEMKKAVQELQTALHQLTSAGWR